MKENLDKLDDGTKGSMETALKDAKEALESEDRSRMDAQFEALQTASHAMAQALYSASGAQQPGAGAGTGAGFDPGAAQQGGGQAPR